MIIVFEDGIDDLAKAFTEMADSFNDAFDTIRLALSIIDALLFRKIIIGQTLVLSVVLSLPFSNNIQARCRSPTKFKLYFSHSKRHRHAVITIKTRHSLLQ